MIAIVAVIVSDCLLHLGMVLSEAGCPQCEEAILKHGAQLLKEKPDDTVELLKKLCVQVSLNYYVMCN